MEPCDAKHTHTHTERARHLHTYSNASHRFSPECNIFSYFSTPCQWASITFLSVIYSQPIYLLLRLLATRCALTRPRCHWPFESPFLTPFCRFFRYSFFPSCWCLSLLFIFHSFLTKLHFFVATHTHTFNCWYRTFWLNKQVKWVTLSTTLPLTHILLLGTVIILVKDALVFAATAN